MNSRVEKLINFAKHKMKKSTDPLHDMGHVERVVKRVKEFSRDIDLTVEEKNSIVLAAWWHDVSRTITKNPSLVWMSFIDDTVSALMLWFGSIRCGLFGDIVGLSTRILLCKSFGTGAILTRLLIKKRHRILVNILDDADTLDMLNKERIIKLFPLVENSRAFKFGYKITISWCLKSRELKLRTAQAREVLADLITKFIAWIKQKEILDWHIKQFGKKWVANTINSVNKFLKCIVPETCS